MSHESKLSRIDRLPVPLSSLRTSSRSPQSTSAGSQNQPQSISPPGVTGVSPLLLRSKPPDTTLAVTTKALPLSPSPGPAPERHEMTCWGRAYEEIKARKPNLLNAYEVIIKDELSDVARPMPSSQQMSHLIRKKLQEIDDRKWKIELGRHTLVVQEQVNRIASAVAFANNFITSALSGDPHAALAWAGVSIFLPLLLNPKLQDDALREGLDSIASILCEFTVTERIYLECQSSNAIDCSPDSVALQKEFEKAITALLTTIIEFQARAACQASKNTILRTIEDIIKYNDWTTLLKTIRTHEEECRKLAVSIDRDSLYSGAERVKQELNRLRSSILVIETTTAGILDEQKAGREADKVRLQCEAELKCLRAFYTTPYESQLRIPRRVSGTCQWFVEHPYYSSWKRNGHADVLWVSADPGCGKSVLTKFLVEEEIPSSASRTTCYFFFKDESEERRSATHALCSILHQLLTQRPEGRKYATQQFNTRGDGLTKSFPVLWDILLTTVESLENGSVLCVIDALDECNKDDRYQLIDCLTSWHEKSTATHGPHSNLKFLLTSRPYYDINRRFSDLISVLPTIHLDAEKQSSKITREINLVIDDKLSALQRMLCFEDSTRLVIAQRLRSVENKTYLWLALILDQVQESLEVSEAELLSTLDAIPNTLSKAYRLMLSKIRGSQIPKARRIFQFVIGAKRPLSVAELNLALTVDSLQPTAAVLPQHKLKHTSSDTIRQICGLFVRVDDDLTIRFLHQTAKEFLLLDDQDGGQNHGSPAIELGLPIKLAESHATMATLCIRSLLLRDFLRAPPVTSSRRGS